MSALMWHWGPERLSALLKEGQCPVQVWASHSDGGPSTTPAALR